MARPTLERTGARPRSRRARPRARVHTLGLRRTSGGEHRSALGPAQESKARALQQARAASGTAHNRNRPRRGAEAEGRLFETDYADYVAWVVVPPTLRPPRSSWISTSSRRCRRGCGSSALGGQASSPPARRPLSGSPGPFLAPYEAYGARLLLEQLLHADSFQVAFLSLEARRLCSGIAFPMLRVRASAEGRRAHAPSARAAPVLSCGGGPNRRAAAAATATVRRRSDDAGHGSYRTRKAGAL